MDEEHMDKEEQKKLGRSGMEEGTSLGIAGEVPGQKAGYTRNEVLLNFTMLAKYNEK